jgi:hypothetical protein
MTKINLERGIAALQPFECCYAAISIYDADSVCYIEPNATGSGCCQESWPASAAIDGQFFSKGTPP